MIFGNFRDIQMPDILALVGRQRGQFVIRGHPGIERADLFFCDGYLVALCARGAWVGEVLQVRDCLVELMLCQEGEFSFERGEEPSCGVLYSLHVDHLLLASMAAVDEINSFHADLPNEQTYFRVIQQDVGWLDPDLAGFWEAASTALRAGTNGISLAAALGISVDRVRLYLYKLRVAGWIVPMHRETRALPPWPTEACWSGAVINQPAPQAPVLAGAFAGEGSPDGAAPENRDPLGEIPPPQYSGDGIDLRRARVARPSVGILNALMGRLASVFWGRPA